MLLFRYLSFREFQPSDWPMTGSEPKRFAHYAPWIATSLVIAISVHQLENQADVMTDELHFMMQMALGGIVSQESQLLSPFKKSHFQCLECNILKVIFIVFVFLEKRLIVWVKKLAWPNHKRNLVLISNKRKWRNFFFKFTISLEEEKTQKILLDYMIQNVFKEGEKVLECSSSN